MEAVTRSKGDIVRKAMIQDRDRFAELQHLTTNMSSIWQAIPGISKNNLAITHS
jgi:hypothetical protein